MTKCIEPIEFMFQHLSFFSITSSFHFKQIIYLCKISKMFAVNLLPPIVFDEVLQKGELLQ